SRLGHRIARIDFDHVVVSPMDDHVGIIGIPFRCAPAPHATLVLAPEVRDDMAFVAISRKDAPAHGLAVLAAGAGAACAALICSSTTPTTPTAVSATTRAACTCACWAGGSGSDPARWPSAGRPVEISAWMLDRSTDGAAARHCRPRPRWGARHRAGPAPACRWRQWPGQPPARR